MTLVPGQVLDTQHRKEQEATQGLLVEPKLQEGNRTQNKAGGSAMSVPEQQPSRATIPAGKKRFLRPDCWG